MGFLRCLGAQHEATDREGALQPPVADGPRHGHHTGQIDHDRNCCHYAPCDRPGQKRTVDGPGGEHGEADERDGEVVIGVVIGKRQDGGERGQVPGDEEQNDEAPWLGVFLGFRVFGFRDKQHRQGQDAAEQNQLAVQGGMAEGLPVHGEQGPFSVERKGPEDPQVEMQHVGTGDGEGGHGAVDEKVGHGEGDRGNEAEQQFSPGGGGRGLGCRAKQGPGHGERGVDHVDFEDAEAQHEDGQLAPPENPATGFGEANKQSQGREQEKRAQYLIECRAPGHGRD